MKIKGIVVNDFSNYKKISMFIVTSVCNFKCEKINNEQCCQNRNLLKVSTMDIDDNIIVDEYRKNSDLVKTLVIGGLEPFDQWDELYNLLKLFRNNFPDDIVIYTGYDKNEIQEYVDKIKKDIPNVIIKFGPYIKNQPTHFDEILGVELASNNQYAEKIS